MRKPIEILKDACSKKIHDVLNCDGELEAYAWPGGYPIAYFTKRWEDVVCPSCASNAMKSVLQGIRNLHKKGLDIGTIISGTTIEEDIFEAMVPIAEKLDIDIDEDWDLYDLTEEINNEISDITDGTVYLGTAEGDGTDWGLWLNLEGIDDFPHAWGVHYEGPPMICESCNKEIRSAYEDPEEEKKIEETVETILDLLETPIANTTIDLPDGGKVTFNKNGIVEYKGGDTGMAAEIAKRVSDRFNE